MVTFQPLVLTLFLFIIYYKYKVDEIESFCQFKTTVISVMFFLGFWKSHIFLKYPNVGVDSHYNANGIKDKIHNRLFISSKMVIKYSWN